MCPDVSRGLRLGASALGLMLPLLLTGAASAQAPGWVDPPARTAVDKASGDKVGGDKTGGDKAAADKAASAVQPTPAMAAPAAPAPKEAATAPSEAPKATAAETERDGASMAGPSRRAERPRRRARRLADTPAPDSATPDALAITPKIPAPSREAADPRFSGWAGRAQELAGDYLSVFSGSNAAMVGGAARFYGPSLRFHGRTTTLAALIAEKSRFAQRWPERRYVPRSSQTACNAALQSCIVRTIVDFRAGSPARGALSQGVAELVLEVSFAGGRPVIVSESSRVLRRGATLGALAGTGANG